MMISTKNSTVFLKKMMAIAGLFWFFFLILYLFGALTFHAGESFFTATHVWFSNSIFHPILLTLLSITLAFHIAVAISCLLYTSDAADE